MRVHRAFGLTCRAAGIQPEGKLIGMGVGMTILGQRISIDQGIEVQGCSSVRCIVMTIMN